MIIPPLILFCLLSVSGWEGELVRSIDTCGLFTTTGSAQTHAWPEPKPLCYTGGSDTEHLWSTRHAAYSTDPDTFLLGKLGSRVWGGEKALQRKTAEKVDRKSQWGNFRGWVPEKMWEQE